MKTHQVEIQRDLNEKLAEVFAKALFDVYNLRTPALIKISSPRHDYEFLLE